MGKATKEAMKRAKKLEKLPMPTRKEIAEVYKEGMEEAQKLQKLLKPQWFLKDVHKKKKKKAKKKAKKTSKARKKRK